MRTTPHALQTERIALPRRLVPRRPTPTVSLADLIKADADYYDALIAGDQYVDGFSIFLGSPTHDAIMAARCTTIAEVRAKLHWMTSDGAGLDGEDDAFRLMVEDLDLILAETRQ